MTERLIEKLDRLGAEAGIQGMTPAIRRFALLVRADLPVQPEQEPVAWFHLHNCEAHFTTEPSEDMVGNYWTPLYTTPPERPWVGLTDGEVITTFNAVCNGKPFQIARILEFARAIEAKLKELNHG